MKIFGGLTGYALIHSVSYRKSKGIPNFCLWMFFKILLGKYQFIFCPWNPSSGNKILFCHGVPVLLIGTSGDQIVSTSLIFQFCHLPGSFYQSCLYGSIILNFRKVFSISIIKQFPVPVSIMPFFPLNGICPHGVYHAAKAGHHRSHQKQGNDNGNTRAFVLTDIVQHAFS